MAHDVGGQGHHDPTGGDAVSARIIIEVRHNCGITRVERDTSRYTDLAEPEEIIYVLQSAVDEVKALFGAEQGASA